MSEFPSFIEEKDKLLCLNVLANLLGGIFENEDKIIPNYKEAVIAALFERLLLSSNQKSTSKSNQMIKLLNNSLAHNNGLPSQRCNHDSKLVYMSLVQNNGLPGQRSNYVCCPLCMEQHCIELLTYQLFAKWRNFPRIDFSPVLQGNRGPRFFYTCFLCNSTFLASA